MDTFSNKDYWVNRYHENRTGWDIGLVSTPIKEYVDQLYDKGIKTLIPGGGNCYEAEYMNNTGFSAVFPLDIAEPPLNNLLERCPNFPKSNIVTADFFDHQGSYDLILEQTFFCSFEYGFRSKYVDKIFQLLKPGGKLVGVLFNHELVKEGGRPFGGSFEEYTQLFRDKFEISILEPCYNSIKPRQGNELFMKLIKL